MSWLVMMDYATMELKIMAIWPQHPDGRCKKLEEMTPAERRRIWDYMLANVPTTDPKKKITGRLTHTPDMRDA